MRAQSFVILTIINLLLILPFTAMAQNWQWAVKLSAGIDVFDMVVDSRGQAYVATGQYARVHKFDSKGDLLWVKEGEAISFSKGLAIDQNDNLYIAGHGNNSIWDGQIVSHIRPQTGLCMYVMKLDPNGRIIWGTTLPKGSPFAIIDIEVDKEGATYIHGSLGQQTSFVAKLNPDGSASWYQKLSGVNYFAGHGAIGLDEAGNCYVTSDYGTNGYPTSLIIAKLDPFGNVLWKITEGPCMGYGIAVQPDGAFFIAAAGGYNCTKKYDSTGTVIWNNNKIILHVADIEVDKENNFYCVGTAASPTITKWDGKGNEIFNLTIPSTGISNALVIKSANIDRSCYVAGTFINSITFGQTVLESTSKASFIGKLESNFALYPLKKSAKFSPNPFNQQSIMVFENMEGEEYNLKIYDILGQLVRSSDKITTRSVVIERGGLSGGAYFYSLSNNRQIIDVGKLIIY